MGFSLGDVANVATGGAFDFARDVYANYTSAKAATKAFDRNVAFDATKYRRSVTDLKAAGLNPMLAYGHAPSSFNAAQPAAVHSSAGGGYSAGLQAQLLKAQIDNINADTSAKKASAGLSSMQTGHSAQQISESAARTDEIRQNMKMFSERVDNLVASTRSLNSSATLTDVRAVLARIDVAYQGAAVEDRLLLLKQELSQAGSNAQLKERIAQAATVLGQVLELDKVEEGTKEGIGNTLSELYERSSEFLSYSVKEQLRNVIAKFRSRLAPKSRNQPNR